MWISGIKVTLGQTFIFWNRHFPDGIMNVDEIIHRGGGKTE